MNIGANGKVVHPPEVMFVTFWGLPNPLLDAVKARGIKIHVPEDEDEMKQLLITYFCSIDAIVLGPFPGYLQPKYFIDLGDALGKFSPTPRLYSERTSPSDLFRMLEEGTTKKYKVEEPKKAQKVK